MKLKRRTSVQPANGRGKRGIGGMSKGLRRRFWAEMGLGLASAVFVLLTLLWKDWVEIVFKVDPDHHGGSLEWAIVGVAVVVCFATLLAARLEWRKASAAPASA